MNNVIVCILIKRECKDSSLLFGFVFRPLCFSLVKHVLKSVTLRHSQLQPSKGRSPQPLNLVSLHSYLQQSFADYTMKKVSNEQGWSEDRIVHSLSLPPF